MRHKWVVWGLLFLLAAGGVGIAVAWPDFTRPGPGTLAVEVPGEGLEVTVAGGGLVRRATASCQLSLPAGSYEVWCSRKGRPGPSSWVDVPAGGTAEVRPAWALNLRSPQRPYVLLARGDRAERSFATLQEAADAARPGDTVEVTGDGPLLSPPVRLDRALTIRAGAGLRPVLRLAPDSQGTLLQTGAALVLEGLELDARPAEGGPSQGRAAVRAEGPALSLAHCRVLQAGVNSAVSGPPAVCQVFRCDLRNTYGASIICPATRGGRLLLEESLLVQAPVQILGPSPGDAAVDVRRCTFALASSCLHLHYRDAPPEGSAPARLTAHDTVWAARDKVLLVNLSRTDALDAPAAALHRRRLLAWAGRGNVYPDGPQLLMHAVNGRVVPITPVTTLEHWRQTWGAAEPGAVQGPVRFTGKELQVRTPGDLDRLRPADFRLASGSAGKGTGEGGRDAGAPVDEVGPGPAYDRWRQSAAYREWRRQTGQPEHDDE